MAKEQYITDTLGGDSSSIIFSAANFIVSNEPEVEARLTLSSLEDVTARGGFYADADNYCYVIFDSDVHANRLFLASNNDGGGEVLTDLGIDAAANVYITLRLRLKHDGTAVVIIGDREIQVPDAVAVTTTLYAPYFYIDNKTTAESRQMRIDYVKVSQDR